MLKIINIEKDDKHTKVTVEVAKRNTIKDPTYKYGINAVKSFIFKNIPEKMGDLISSGPMGNYREDYRIRTYVFQNPPPPLKPKPLVETKKPRTRRRKKKVSSPPKEES